MRHLGVLRAAPPCNLVASMLWILTFPTIFGIGMPMLPVRPLRVSHSQHPMLVESSQVLLPWVRSSQSWAMSLTWMENGALVVEPLQIHPWEWATPVSWAGSVTAWKVAMELSPALLWEVQGLYWTICQDFGDKMQRYRSWSWGILVYYFNADYNTSSDRYLKSYFLMLHWYTSYIRLLF